MVVLGWASNDQQASAAGTGWNINAIAERRGDQLSFLGSGSLNAELDAVQAELDAKGWYREPTDIAVVSALLDALQPGERGEANTDVLTIARKQAKAASRAAGN